MSSVSVQFKYLAIYLHTIYFTKLELEQEFTSLGSKFAIKVGFWIHAFEFEKKDSDAVFNVEVAIGFW